MSVASNGTALVPEGSAYGKRVARPNPADEWEIVDIPELRIVNDETLNRVKAPQSELAFEISRDDGGNALNRAHRRQFLFSGLLHCHTCGGYAIIVKDEYGCSNHRRKGTSQTTTRSRVGRSRAGSSSGSRSACWCPSSLPSSFAAFRSR